MNNHNFATNNSDITEMSDASIADFTDRKRDRSWRRLQAYKNKGKALSIKHKSNRFYEHEKNWKLLYTRKVKLKRALQLGKEYPRKTMRDMVQYEISQITD